MNKEDRIKEYLASIDWDMEINPFIFHLNTVNWNGSGKDLMLNADIFELYTSGKSLFDEIIRFVFNRPYYYTDIEGIYANCKMNSVFGDDYYRVKSYQDIKDAENGVLYLHDCEVYFNSLGMNMRSEDGKLIKFINNKRKDNIIFRMSLHRFMSIHVRVRELIPCWIIPDLFLVPNMNEKRMNDYVVKYRVCDCDGFTLFENILEGLPKYAKLYDTLEKADILSKDL